MIPAGHVVGLALLICVWSTSQVAVGQEGPSPAESYFFALGGLSAIIIIFVLYVMVITFLSWRREDARHRSYDDMLLDITHGFFLHRFLPNVRHPPGSLRVSLAEHSEISTMTAQRRIIAVAALLLAGAAVLSWIVGFAAALSMVAGWMFALLVSWRVRDRHTGLPAIADGLLRFAAYAAFAVAILINASTAGASALTWSVLFVAASIPLLALLWLKAGPDRTVRALADVFD